MADFEYNKKEDVHKEANYQIPTAQVRRAFVCEQSTPTSNESILSVGCAPGFEPAEFASTGDAKRVVGIESNPIMLGRARERSPDDISLLQGDATALPVQMVCST